jgi:allantoicase
MQTKVLYNGIDSGTTTDGLNINVQDTVVGLCTVEVSGTGGSNKPTVIVQGKFQDTDEEETSTGWVNIVAFRAIDPDTVIGEAIGIFPHMRVILSNNGGARRVTVAIGFFGG